MWHESIQVVEMCSDHAVRLDIAGTPYRLSPIVQRLSVLLERPKGELVEEEGDSFDFDEDLLPEDSW